MKVMDEKSDEEFFDCESGEEAVSSDPGAAEVSPGILVDQLVERCVSGDAADDNESEKCSDWKIDEEHFKELEGLMTQSEKEVHKDAALELKKAGNVKFGEGNFEDAASIYTKALLECPPSFAEDRAMIFGNRAACRMKLEDYEAAILDCSKALELDSIYLKALSRRAWCYEKKEEYWDKALEDHKKVLELDPLNKASRTALLKLPPMIAERNERTKAEMIGKLKDLGNLILRPFGMSTDNFKLEPNEQGGYSVKMEK